MGKKEAQERRARLYQHKQEEAAEAQRIKKRKKWIIIGSACFLPALLLIQMIYVFIFELVTDMIEAADSNLYYELTHDESGYYVSDAGANVDKNLTIPATHEGLPVIGIDVSAFKESHIESIAFPDSIVTISRGAFSRCHNLSLLKIGKNSSLCYIGDGAFDECTGLSEVIIESSEPLTIGEEAFKNCSALRTVKIPNVDSITIEANAFAECGSLSALEFVHLKTAEISENAFPDTLYTTHANAYYLKIQNNPYYLLLKAQNTSITECEIHSNTVIINSRAFEKCSSLQNITIPSSVKEIGSYAFSSCSSLKTVVIPATVETLGQSIFSRCKLTVQVYSSVLPKGWDDDWYDNGSLTLEDISPLGKLVKATIQKDLEEARRMKSKLESEANSLKKRGDLMKYTLDGHRESIKNYRIIGDWENVEYYTQKYNEALAEQEEYYAQAAEKRNEVKPYSSKVSSLESALSGGIYHSVWQSYAKELASQVPETPGKETIGEGPWYDSNGLEYEYLDPDEYSFVDEPCFGVKGLGTCTASDIVIPATFQGLPVRVVIGFAFKDCESIQSVSLPDGLTMILDAAFRNCKNLQEIVIPLSLKSVGFRAFDSCENLQSVFYKGTSAQWENIEIEPLYDRLDYAARYYYTTTQPSAFEDFGWRYVNGVPTPWEIVRP